MRSLREIKFFNIDVFLNVRLRETQMFCQPVLKPISKNRMTQNQAAKIC